MNDSNQIQVIMLRYLNNESTDEETKVLNEWIGENKGNAEEFEVVKKLWFDSADTALIDIDKETAWKTFLIKLKLHLSDH